MKQNYSILKLLFLLLTTAAFAQGEAGVWYFGNQAGLDFSNANPTAITNSQLSANEGCATLSDNQGNLLLYTNGLTIWNKNHVPMENGTGLFGYNSSAQSAVIIQKPGSPSLFYVFTTNPFEENGGLRYSIVDMSANGDTGAVTAKNILLSNSTCEKISVIKHANGQDFWVVTHMLDSDAFYSCLVTASGISPAQVISHSGCTVPADDDRSNAIGYMKISPDGKKLAACHTFMDKTELFDFNTTTGQVTNGQTISTDQQPYGVEFSPDNSVLYISSMAWLNYKLYQFNLNATNIADSKTVIASFTDNPGALQIAPNGKIYLAMAETNKLTVINNPNHLGAGCNVGVNTVDLGGRICMLGLPSFCQSIFYTKVNSLNVCAGNNTAFTYESSYSNPISVSWNFGDASTSIQPSASHQYNNPGTYTVTVMATYPNVTIMRTKEVTIIASPSAHAIAEQTFCVNASEAYDLSQNDAAITGNASGFTVTYFASASDAQNNSNPLNIHYTLTPGSVTIYANVVNAQGCSKTTSFKLTVFAQPVDVTPTDFTTCDGMVRDGFAEFDLDTKTSEILSAQHGDFHVAYFTSEDDAEHDANEVSNTFYNTVNPQPVYAKISNDNGCYKVVSFNLIVQACNDGADESAFPKFFTPNGDGFNDTWKTKAVVGADTMKINIFDRYGIHIKTITSSDPEWDGTMNGIDLPSDDYWYTVTGENITEYRGHFALKR